MFWINLLSIVAAMLLLGIIIVVHELGHYTLGRVLGFKIDEFAIGFGPKLAKFKSRKTGILYSLRPFPIGGFVKFHGEDEATGDADEFSKKPIWKRFIAIFAGAAFNIIFALILAIIFLTIFGERLPIIGEVETGTPAYEAGIIVGDNITFINGEDIDFGPEATINVDNLGRSGAKSVNVTFLRDGKEYNYDIPCYYDSETKTYRIGVGFQKESTQFGFFEALGLSFKWVIFIIKEMFAFLGGLIFGTQSVADVMGPVGTIAVIGDVIKYGLESIMRLASLLCINLGIVNLLPLPALDGGRLALLVVEGIRRKPISPQKEGYIHLAGFILLLILMALLTYQDIARLITQ